MAKKTETAFYLSTKHLGLKIILRSASVEKHEKTGQMVKIPGKYFKFTDGKLYLSDPEDIKLMDDLLDGKGSDHGYMGAKPVGVVKVSKKAVDLQAEIEKDSEASEDIKAMKEVEARSKKGRAGGQGATGNT